MIEKGQVMTETPRTQTLLDALCQQVLNLASELERENAALRSRLERAEKDVSKLRCIIEWSAVNDPPCHPSDSHWKPCPLCVYLKPEADDGFKEASDG
jgi:hypothetical protein